MFQEKIDLKQNARASLFNQSRAEFFLSRLGQRAGDGGTENADVVDGTVVVVGEGLLDSVDDVKALDYLAENGVLAVEMGRAASLAFTIQTAAISKKGGTTMP